jgi:hypothetical protein
VAASIGIQFLTCIVQVHATIHYYYGSTAASVEAVEAAMRDEISQNPNNPVLKITIGVHDPYMVWDQWKSIEKEEDTLSLTTSTPHHWDLKLSLSASFLIARQLP